MSASVTEWLIAQSAISARSEIWGFGQRNPRVQLRRPGPRRRPVEISYWRAAWQATVDGRGDAITDLYPDAAVDHYPFDSASLAKGSAEQRAMADRYAPARALGNTMAGPRDNPVQHLIATGPGTLEPSGQNHSTGRGTRTKDGWAVVLRRPLPAGLARRRAIPGGFRGLGGIAR